MCSFLELFDYSRNRVEIRRQHYLDALGRFAEGPSIVAVVGLRRVGKSVLLRQFADQARSSQQVVYIDKESLDFADVRTAQDILRHVNAASRKGEDRLVVVDEVQQVEEWERAVASLNGEPHTRVIISGSNASLFSGALATRIAGRYLTLQVFPLTLAEFAELHAKRSGAEIGRDELFRLYLRIGGLPGLLHTDLSERVTYQMLGDIFNTIAVRDIISRHNIRDVTLFQDVTRFAMDNIGSPVSAKRIADFLRPQRRRVSVGTADSGEIDFVAEDRSGKVYIQVAYLLESRETIDRERKAFSLLEDAYPRYLLTLDPHQPRDLEGVRHRSVLRFLLGDSLDA